MRNLNPILCASILVLTSVGRATPQVVDTSPFPMLSGKDMPLTIMLKDLDANWRVFTTSSSSYQDIISSAMTGGTGNRVYTKGLTVTVGSETFLVTYKPEGPDMSSIFSGMSPGGPPKPKPISETSMLRLSLLNLHALNSMDGIRVFDLKEELAASQKGASVLDTIQKQSSGTSKAVPATPVADSEPELLKKGSIAPDFVVHDDSGKAVKLSSFRGKTVVLDFWSTWCGPCQESLPATNALAAKYAGKNVVVLGVNVWDTKQAFHGWLPDHKKLNSIKFAIDTSSQGQDVATKLYHVSGIPTQYVIDKKGRVVEALVGYSGDEAELTSGIKLALLKG